MWLVLLEEAVGMVGVSVLSFSFATVLCRVASHPVYSGLDCFTSRSFPYCHILAPVFFIPSLNAVFKIEGL
jgi:hypothetical protein